MNAQRGRPAAAGSASEGARTGGGQRRRIVTLERARNEHLRPVNITVQRMYFGDWSIENMPPDDAQQGGRDRGGNFSRDRGGARDRGGFRDNRDRQDRGERGGQERPARGPARQVSARPAQPVRERASEAPVPSVQAAPSSGAEPGGDNDAQRRRRRRRGRRGGGNGNAE